jgi:hypothetical protein
LLVADSFGGVCFGSMAAPRWGRFSFCRRSFERTEGGTLVLDRFSFTAPTGDSAGVGDSVGCATPRLVKGVDTDMMCLP